jgi:hypothetical protein
LLQSCFDSRVSGKAGEISSESLEISESDAVPKSPVLVSSIGKRESVLGVHDFEDGGFAVFVAEGSEAEAVFGEFGGAGESGEFVCGGVGFGVERLKLGEQLALGEAKLAFGLIAAKFGLLNAALGGAPIPDGNGDGSDDGGAKSVSAVGADGEVSGVDAIEVVEIEGWEIFGAGGLDGIV